MSRALLPHPPRPGVDEPATSVGVPTNAVSTDGHALVRPADDELDDPSIELLAQTVARWWRRLLRIGVAVSLGALGSWVALGASTLVIPLLFGALAVQFVALGVTRRLVRDEVASLGFDAATQQRVLAAWSWAQQTQVPLFSTTKAEWVLRLALRGDPKNDRDALAYALAVGLEHPQQPPAVASNDETAVD